MIIIYVNNVLCKYFMKTNYNMMIIHIHIYEITIENGIMKIL